MITWQTRTTVTDRRMLLYWLHLQLSLCQRLLQHITHTHFVDLFHVLWENCTLSQLVPSYKNKDAATVFISLQSLLINMHRYEQPTHTHICQHTQTIPLTSSKPCIICNRCGFYRMWPSFIIQREEGSEGGAEDVNVCVCMCVLLQLIANLTFTPPFFHNEP